MYGLRIYLNCIIVVLVLFKQTSWTLSPVILIPGDGGSQLEAKLNKSSVVSYICSKTTPDFFNIWLNLELLLPYIISCWIDNTRLEFDNNTKTTSNPDGVDIRVPGWGDTQSVEWLDPSHQKSGAYFNTITDALVKIGYIRNVSIRGAPYDFRKAPNENGEFFVKLKTLIEDTYTQNNGSSVTLLVHSMGGSMALHFIRLQSQKWKDQYIRRMITLSTPWAGAVKALKTFAIGDDLGSRVLREKVMRVAQITFPSLAWLLPDPKIWGDKEPLVITTTSNFTVNTYEQFLNNLSLPLAWEMRKVVQKYSGDYSMPGVNLHCLFGHNIKTVERLVYKPRTWLDGYPVLEYGDGDGTVNARSLSVCEMWKKHSSYFQTPKTVEVERFPNAEHLEILHDPRVIDTILKIMMESK